MSSAIAKLPTQSHAQLTQAPVRLKIALVGVMLRQSLLNIEPTQNNLHLLQSALNLKQAQSQLSDLTVDVLVVEQGELAAAEEQIVLLHLVKQTCHATAVLILYRFASSEAIRQLRLAGFHVARIPVDMLEIDHLCRAALARALSLAEQKMRDGKSARFERQQLLTDDSVHARGLNQAEVGIPTRLLDDDELMHIAKSATSIHCECPRHLVDLLQMLTSFERYSAQCENLNSEDAKLHHDLHSTAAHARASLEKVLVRVAKAEGIVY